MVPYTLLAPGELLVSVLEVVDLIMAMVSVVRVGSVEEVEVVVAVEIMEMKIALGIILSTEALI
jgi:hypothetical protein